eukprot:6368723-Amphidinium_carterae.1
MWSYGSHLSSYKCTASRPCNPPVAAERAVAEEAALADVPAPLADSEQPDSAPPGSEPAEERQVDGVDIKGKSKANAKAVARCTTDEGGAKQQHLQH